MSFSIVRTCRRCGTRSERDIVNHDQLAVLVSALVHHLGCPESDDGCPDCCPELRKPPSFDADSWRRSVDLARSRLPK